jgi:hypothetical protein
MSPQLLPARFGAKRLIVMANRDIWAISDGCLHQNYFGRRIKIRAVIC